MFSSTVGLEPTRDKPNCLVGSRNSHYAMRTFYSDITPFYITPTKKKNETNSSSLIYDDVKAPFQACFHLRA